MSAVAKILLVPVDGSRGADKAASLAAPIAEKLGVPLRLLFAYPRNPLERYGLSDGLSTRSNPEALDYFSGETFAQLREQTAEKAFGAARKAIGETTAPVEQELVPGEPAAAILEHASETDSPMIVIGSRGLNRVTELLLGSVSQRVLHHAKCPVIVVH